MADEMTRFTKISRRAALGGAAALLSAPALANECPLGPLPHTKGPEVWMGLDQVELDAAYDQTAYAPLRLDSIRRYASASQTMRAHIGQPMVEAYGPTEIEKLEIYRAKQDKAPVFVFVHGGAWLSGLAKDYAFPAEMFVNAGVNYVCLDFIAIKEAHGDLRVMADQVRRGIAWVYQNIDKFGGDRDRFYVGGHSSGAHLAALALVSDMQKDFGFPADMVKGALLMSGLYDMKPVRLSSRSSYVTLTDEIEQAMSSQRHLDQLRTPLTVTYGSQDTPEFQRQSRDFATAVKGIGKLDDVVESPNYNHFEMMESLANPYGPNGRAALAMMKLGKA
jgi:arylformamidase